MRTTAAEREALGVKKPEPKIEPVKQKPVEKPDITGDLVVAVMKSNEIAQENADKMVDLISAMPKKMVVSVPSKPRWTELLVTFVRDEDKNLKSCTFKVIASE